MREHRRYKVTDDRFGRLAVALREKIGLTQSKVAAAIGVSERSIQQWESGVAYPVGENLKKLIGVYVQNGAFAPGTEREGAHALWEQVAASASRHKGLFDDAWFDALLAEERFDIITIPTLKPTNVQSLPRRFDWGEAPDAAVVYGRDDELHTLTQWLVADGCRVVAVLGMGGIGKTTLSAYVAQQVAPAFARVVWRSLRNAPPLEELLADCFQILAEQPSSNRWSSTERGITRLLDILRQQRCLLVFDNVDTLLEANTITGRYRAGYEDYRLLFQRLAESAHQSCALLTSREMLSELEPLEGTHSPVRSLKLAGLTPAASQAVLRDKGLFGPARAWEDFVQHYAGTPLALKIAAATVRDLFGGDLLAFLHEGPMTLHSLQQMLDDQFERVTPLERDVLIWLAIERDMVVLETLYANVAGTVVKKDLLAALKSLRRRSLVERDERSTAFTLQPVVMEYVSDWLVTQASNDVVHNTITVLAKYPLLKSQSKDYIRESQSRMLLHPLLDRLRAELGGTHEVEAHLLALMHWLRAQSESAQGYAGGTLVNLLIALRGHLRDTDCSLLTLRQAYLGGVEAQDANFAGADIRETRFTTPLETIASMTLSPDGTYLAVGSFSGQVQLWRVDDGALVWAVKGHTRMTWALAFSHDGTTIASGGHQGRLKLWDVASGQCVWAVQAHSGWVRSVAWSPDGCSLATGGDDGTVRLWNLHNSTSGHVLHGHHGSIWSAVWSPDSALLITGASDGTVRVWNVRAGTCLDVLRGHTGGIFTVAFHPSGRFFASGGEEDGQITLWDAHNRQRLSTFMRHITGLVSLAFNPDGTLMASGGSDGVVELWQIGDTVAKHYVGALEGHHWLVGSVSFAPNGLLASVAYGGQVRLWEAERGKLLKTIQGFSRLITTIAWSPDGTTLVQGEDSGMIRIWDVQSGTCIASMHGHVGPVWTIAWSPDGTSFASGGDDREIKLWDARSGNCLKRFRGHLAIIWTLGFSPDGTTLASGGGDRLIRLYNLTGNEDQIATLDGSAAQTLSLSFRADGQLLASGHLNGEIKLWDLACSQCCQTMHHHVRPVGALHFAADGKTLFSSSNHDVLKWWDVTTGECIKTLNVDAVGNWFKAVAFSPDGLLLATGSNNQTVQLWHVDAESNANQSRILSAHAGQIWAVALSHDHTMLASADDQGTIVVWDTHTDTVLRRLTTDRPYERMNIHAIKEANPAQRAALQALGAVDTRGYN